MIQFVDGFGSKSVRVHFDTGNIMQYHFPEHWIAMLGKRIQNVHVKEYSKKVHEFNLNAFRPLLDGTVDWPAVLEAFDKAGYRGYLTFEYFNPYPHWPEALVYHTSDAMDRMSSELSAMYRDLEQKVEERTRELHDANIELKAGEERYRALFNGTNDSIFVHPVPGGGGPMKFIDVNETACMKLGYSRKELLELSPELIDAPGHEAGREAAIREIAQNGHAIFEMAHVAKDGRVIPVEISSRVFVLKGAQQGLSIVRDISERKMVEEKALRERRLNESIVNYMPAGVAFLDNGFILRKFNALYAGMIRKYTPYTPDEALGMCYFDYVPGSREQVEGWFKEVRDSGESADRKGFELKIGAGEDEKATYWDTAVTPVFDEAGKVEGILILTQDITERKRSEDSLKERVEELEMFRKLTLKRELRLRELKDRIEALEMELKGARA